MRVRSGPAPHEAQTQNTHYVCSTSLVSQANVQGGWATCRLRRWILLSGRVTEVRLGQPRPALRTQPTQRQSHQAACKACPTPSLTITLTNCAVVRHFDEKAARSQPTILSFHLRSGARSGAGFSCSCCSAAVSCSALRVFHTSVQLLCRDTAATTAQRAHSPAFQHTLPRNPEPPLALMCTPGGHLVVRGRPLLRNIPHVEANC